MSQPPATQLRMSCIASDTERAQAGLAELTARHKFVDVDDSDVIVALGGDGFLLHAMHGQACQGRPIFGMNQGTVGFLMNRYSPDGLVERLTAASTIGIRPLRMTATMLDGTTEQLMAFNEVSVLRGSGQSANIRVTIDGVERIASYAGDGMIIATAAGSTAYNLSARGPIIPLGADLLAVTPVSPFRPRRWRGALVSRDCSIELENLDPGKRPLIATADFRQLDNVVHLHVREAAEVEVRLMFDPDQSLAERITAEQFVG